MCAAKAAQSSIGCPYCGNPAELVNGTVIYPHRRDLYDRKFYHCAPCKAWVGVHVKTNIPFGRLANAKLRRLKMEVHVMFDALWQSNTMSRGEAYRWLSRELNIPSWECHIGMFSEDQCAAVVQAINKFRRQALMARMD
jgi:hypothetical protein